MIQPHEIIMLEAKHLIGMSMQTSVSRMKDTAQLWRRFMPQRTILNSLNSDLYSVQIMPERLTFEAFTPFTEFTKWAAMLVEEGAEVPQGMERLVVPSGHYAIFRHQGSAAEYPKTFNSIMRDWLPSSGWVYDNRPQFDVMGKEYLGHENRDSVEYIYLPVKRKGNS